MSAEFSWGTFDDGFVAELAAWIAGRKVLEVFAGNGLLASKLAALGVAITATSILSGHDGHRNAMHFQVLELDAAHSVREYGATHDLLMMSWPVVSEAAIVAAVLWGDRPIIYIGETTDYSIGQLGGCASDLFFELTTEVEAFSTYAGRSGYERAGVRLIVDGAREKLLDAIANRKSSFHM